MLENYLSCLELAYFELPFAFEGLADENVWKRPVPNLLSIGELAGHVAYSQVKRLAGGATVESPLVDPCFYYYPTTSNDTHRTLTAQQVCDDVLRVHRETVALFRARALSPDDSVPELPGEWTQAESLKYLVFHVSYHVGQMYSVRYLLGDTPPDN